MDVARTHFKNRIDGFISMRGAKQALAVASLNPFLVFVEVKSVLIFDGEYSVHKAAQQSLGLVGCAEFYSMAVALHSVAKILVLRRRHREQAFQFIKVMSAQLQFASDGA